jgi:hypothetical protein
MKLGFHEPLSRLYVFVKNEANHLWYWLDDGKKIYIPHTALTGTLKSLEVKEASTSHGDRMKADFEIIADRRYVLRSGVDSAFSRGMLMIINVLSDEQLAKPITLELKPGDEKGNVLVSARDPETFEPILTGSWENVNWNLLLNRAIARLGGSSQPQPQPQSQPQRQPGPQPQPQSTITQKQYQDLLARSKQVGYTTSGFAELLAKYGCSRGSEITQRSYPQLWAEVCDRSIAQKMNSRAESEMVRH